VRLDHLLSKEQHTTTTPNSAPQLGGRWWQPRVSEGLTECLFIFFLWRDQQSNELADADFWVGTLLGPETTHVLCCFWIGFGQASAWTKPSRPSLMGSGWWFVWWWVCWLVFENCIVDASIFDRLWC
jgi:hypothetical protein